MLGLLNFLFYNLLKLRKFYHLKMDLPDEEVQLRQTLRSEQEATQKIKSFSYINLLTLNAAWGAFYFGYSMAVINSMTDKLSTVMEWTVE